MTLPLPDPTRRRRAFTIIELLVVVSIIALLIGILLPAIGAARDRAKQTQSLANLRQLGTAHVNYAAEWNDRQFTLVNDNISTYGNNTASAFDNFYQQHGGAAVGIGAQHPGPILGWAYLQGTSQYVYFGYWTHEGADEGPGPLNAANCSLNLPIAFTSPGLYFGSFRLINVRQFNQYVSGRFYDKTFYAPKDNIVTDCIETVGYNGVSCFDSPGEYCDRPVITGGELPVWSSYVLSPAAMYAPDIMRAPDGEGDNGWRNPWLTPGGFRSPAMGQAAYPSLKTHMLEHHWLQNRRAECNAAFNPGSYHNCEPFYFNMAFESTPMTLFYDGHVAPVGTREAQRADGRQLAQTNGVAGLWHRNTSYGANGYFINASYDNDVDTSYHILTTDGIKGRDLTAQAP